MVELHAIAECLDAKHIFQLVLEFLYSVSVGNPELFYLAIKLYLEFLVFGGTYIHF